MNWILSFLWVLVVEYFQNIPFVVGLVAGSSSIRRGLAWWKWSLMYLGSSFVSAIAISSTDWIKVMATTRTTYPPDLLRILRTGTIFSVACGLLVVYYILTSRLKHPSLADVLFGLLIGAATAIIQAKGFSPAFVALHALGFAVAGGGLIALVRRSGEVVPGRKMLVWIGWLTLMISILIVFFDYVPFLRS